MLHNIHNSKNSLTNYVIGPTVDINLTYHTGHFADSIDGNELGLHVFQFTPLVSQHQLLARDGTALLVQPANTVDTVSILKLLSVVLRDRPELDHFKEISQPNHSRLIFTFCLGELTVYIISAMEKRCF